MWDRITTTDRDGFKSLVGASGNYSRAHGVSINSFFAPFTTKFYVSGDLVIPAYEQNLWGSGGNWELNPFGDFSIERGLLFGSGIPGDINDNIDPSSVRTFGFRGPLHLVGAGYDQFGFPAPNFVSGWNISGTFSPTGHAPSGGFLGGGFSYEERLANVPEWFYRAGPVDLRWDVNRRVWSAPQSVYAARIKSVAVQGGGDPEMAQFPENVSYDAEIISGPAQTLFVTGVFPVSPRRNANTVKIQPLVSGDHCLIIHTINSSGMPGYAIYSIEKDAVESCDDAESTPAFRESFLLSNSQNEILSFDETIDGSIRWALSSNTPSGSPLNSRYGGTGASGYNFGDILFGDVGGDLKKGIILGVSGILASHGSNGITISTDPTFDFATLATGINNSITELQGLTTPLSLDQGGTGASGLVFVTTAATGQTINGIKQFAIGVVLSSGSQTSPQLRFDSDGSNWGIWYRKTGQRQLGIVVSGNNQLYLNTSGTYLHESSLSILPGENFTSASLIVQRHDSIVSGVPIDIVQISSHNNLTGFMSIDTSGTVNMYQPSGFVSDFYNLYNEDGIVIGKIDASGKIVSRNKNFMLGISGEVATISTENITADRTLHLPNENGTLATRNLMESGYNGVVEVVDSIASVWNLTFVSGILVSYSK